MLRRPPRSTLFPYTRSSDLHVGEPTARKGILLPGSPVMRVTLRWNGSRKTGMRYAGFGVSGADRKSTRLNSSHSSISYAVFCLKKKKPRQVERVTHDSDRRI